MGKEALANTCLHTTDLYTTGIRILPVCSPDLTLLAGTTGLHITEVPAETQVREILMYDMAFMANVSCETKPCRKHAEITRQHLYRPGADSRNSSSGRSDILDEFRLNHGKRQIISIYTADLSTLLLLCGDIESNPGPANTGLKPPPRNRRRARVSID